MTTQEQVSERAAVYWPVGNGPVVETPLGIYGCRDRVEGDEITGLAALHAVMYFAEIFPYNAIRLSRSKMGLTFAHLRLGRGDATAILLYDWLPDTDSMFVTARSLADAIRTARPNGRGDGYDLQFSDLETTDVTDPGAMPFVPSNKNARPKFVSNEHLEYLCDALVYGLVESPTIPLHVVNFNGRSSGTVAAPISQLTYAFILSPYGSEEAIHVWQDRDHVWLNGDKFVFRYPKTKTETDE